jgi:putative inorganic carbon (HCO3(-)) transporter
MESLSLWEKSFIYNALKKSGDFLRKYLQPYARTSLIAGWIDPLLQLSLLLLLFLMPFISSGKIALLTFLSLILWIAKGLTKREEWSPKIDLFSLLFLLWIGISLLSTGLSPFFTPSLKGFAKFLVYLTVYFLFLSNFDTRERKERAVFIVSLSALIVSLYGVWQEIIGVAPLALWEDIEAIGENVVRVYSTLKNPNLLGGYLIGVIPLCLSLLIMRRDWRRPLLALTLVSSLLALLWTYSRGAYIGFFASILIFFLLLLHLAWHKGKTKARLAITLFLLTFILLSSLTVIASPTLRGRVKTIFSIWGHTSNVTRFTIWKSSLQMFKDNWLIGIGPGNDTFRRVYAFYMRPRFNSLASYNIFLQVAIENGILGLIVFLAMLYVLFSRGIKRILEEETSTAILIIGAISACVAPLFHGLVDTIWYRPQPQVLFWLSASLIIGNSRKIGSILTMNFGGIGDEILFIPTLRALKKRFPQAFLSVVGEPRSLSVLEGEANEIIPLDVKGKLSWGEIFRFLSYVRYLKPDIALASGTSPFTPLILFLSGAGKRIGYKQSKLSFLNTKNADGTRNDYIAFVHYRLAKAVGIEDEPSLPSLEIPDEAKEWAEKFLSEAGLKNRFILIHPGIGKMSIKRGIDRRWENDKWKELMRSLKEEGYEILVSLGPDEKEMEEELMMPDVHFAFPSDIFKLAALIERSSLLVCLDSSAMHLAVAQGKPLVALFGPSDEEEVLPRDERFRPVYANLDCRPCLWDRRRTSCPELTCMKKIEVEDVLKAVRETIPFSLTE